MERKVKRFASKVVSLALALSMVALGAIVPKVEANAEGTLRCEWHSHDRKSMDWTLDQISETSATITFKAYGESGIKMSYQIREGDFRIQGYSTNYISSSELEFSQGSDSNCGICTPYYAAPIELSNLSPDTTYSIVMEKFYLSVNDNTSMNDFTNYYFVFKTNAHDFSEGWHTDPENHWHECLNSNCAETNPGQIDFAQHTWNRDVPTATESVVCTECGYVVVQHIK